MAVHGGDTDEQLFGNFSVGLSDADKPQHLHLALSQAIGIGWRSDWSRLRFLLHGEGAFEGRLHLHVAELADGEVQVLQRLGPLFGGLRFAYRISGGT